VSALCRRSLQSEVIDSTLGTLLQDERDRLKVQGRVAEQIWRKVMGRLTAARFGAGVAAVVLENRKISG
jgi:hypothetical protein